MVSCDLVKQFKTDSAQEGVLVAQRGDSISTMSKAEKKVEMEYLSPMQAHAAMEPLCATASVTPEGCEIWAPTQSSDFATMMAMGVTKLPPEKIKIQTTYL